MAKGTVVAWLLVMLVSVDAWSGPGQHILQQQPGPHRIVVEVPQSPARVTIGSPSAEELAKLYATVGRELKALDASQGMAATIDLWPRFRWIRINDALATPEKRTAAATQLQRVLTAIRSK